MWAREQAVAVAVAAAVVAASVSCSSTSQPEDGRLHVTAAFYPLAFAAEQIGGAQVDVTSLTKPGAEPHDVELTPRQVAELTRADVVVYEKGFQPAVDEAVANEAREAGFDVSPAARLTLTAPTEGGGSDTSRAVDPHFWLDPVRYAEVVTALAAELGRLDPAHASTYASNAESLAVRLRTLDEEFRAGLAQCANRQLVTGHAAFGYLADRYGLTQVAIAGVDPEQEPTAAQMSDLVDVIGEHHVTTVYAETLVSPALATAVANEAGARVEVLDPLEGITSESAGDDYFAVMRSNLTTLQAGQQCS